MIDRVLNMPLVTEMNRKVSKINFPGPILSLDISVKIFHELKLIKLSAYYNQLFLD